MSKRSDRDRRRYATNGESRARQRERQNVWARDKYAGDPEYRANDLAKTLERRFFAKGWGFRSTI